MHVPRFPKFYTGICRLIALPCLIGFGRSRMIFYYLRDVGPMQTCGKKVRNNDEMLLSP
jgi:hypothetical protein